MNWQLVSVLVLAIAAISFFIKVGKLLKEREYLKEQKRQYQEWEKMRQKASIKQKKRESLHEKRLQEISRARTDPKAWERLLSQWPDQSKDPTPPKADS